ncbi:MAG: PAS domain S-box protein, partial [Planctomycetota bacterium]
MRILAFTSEPEYYTPLSECPEHSVLFAEYQDPRARRLWVACAPQLILLDVFRLGSTADALFAEFESLWPGKIPPVLVVCPPQGWEIAHQWLARGAYDFLIEPLNCRVVSARLTAIQKHLHGPGVASLSAGEHPSAHASREGTKSEAESSEESATFPRETIVSEAQTSSPLDDDNGRGMIHIESRFFHDRESLFQTIFERAAIGLVLADFDGRFVRVNRAFAEWLGYTPEELEGRQIAEFSHPDDVVREIEEFTILVTGEKDGIVFEKRYRHKDGRFLWGRLHVLILERYSDKRGLGFAMVEDITREKDVAGKLGEMEIRWNKLLDNAPDLFFLADAETRLLYVNKITVDELTMDDVIGRRCTTWIHPDDQEVFEEHFRLALETGKPQRFVDRDVFGCWWENRLVPLPSSDDAVVLGIVSDITEQVQ